MPTTYGRKPAEGLDPRICTVCGSSYQPYREFQRSCSRKCYKKLPDVVASNAEIKARPEVRERRAASKRVAANPERRQYNLRQNLKRLYGISLEDYQAMVAAQGNRCAICGDEPDPNGKGAAARLHVDHHHGSGRNRDLLCCRCNAGIGYFLLDDPVRLRAAAEYVERHKE